MASSEPPYVTVVGGANVDIGGMPYASLVPRDSNPGTVSKGLGGVGRNIAHNLALLGTETFLLSAFGDDANAQWVVDSCSLLGIDVSRSLIVEGGRTSTYLFILDERGEMVLAVSDMDIYERLTPEVLAERRDLLDASSIVIVDTNIPEESIAWLAQNCAAPIFCDPVSTIKAKKVAAHLSAIHTLKPNRLEAELLSGVPITDDASLREAARVLLGRGVERVFISLGADGVYAADRQGEARLPSIPGHMVNVTGCGDAFMAAIAWATLAGLGLEEVARAGLGASAIAMESAETISPLMSHAALKERAGL